MIYVIPTDDCYQMMKENLEDLALRLKGIIDTAIDGIITISSRGIVESLNKSAAIQFGYIPSEVVGNNIKMLMPSSYKEEHDGYLHRYNTTKVPRIIGVGREVTGMRKDGSTFPFRLAVSEVILNDRIIFTGIIHDLSDIKIAEKRLIDMNEQLEHMVVKRTNELEDAVNKLLSTNETLQKRERELELSLTKEKELNELKSRFVSMASHEFRTPLSTIMSSASLIGKYTEESQNEKREKHIVRIKSAVNALTGILNDFLSLSKIEEGKVIVQKSQIRLENLCMEIIDEVKGIMKPGQEITHHGFGDLQVETDKRILKNVLFNLISNAIKYSPENSEITCSLYVEENNINLAIKDHGMGIPEAEQKYLFERFFRASNVETIQGTGLGLSIVKRYITLLGGTISFESKENIGTKFIISIPKKYEKDFSN